MIHRIFFYLLIVLLPTQLGYHFWPEWSFVLGRRLEYLSPTLYLTDILMFLLVVSWKPQLPKKIHYLPFFVFAVANIYFSTRWQVSLYTWIKVAEYSLLILYIKQTKPSVLRISQALGIAVLYSSTIAIVQFVLQHSIGGPLWFLGERTFSASTSGIAMTNFQTLYKLRAYGTFPHPNVLGGFLAISLSFITSSPIIFAVGTVALLLTFSRSAWIVFLIGLLFVSKKKLIPLLVSIGVVLGILYSFSAVDESVVVRQQLNTAALEIWKSHPWFGVGLGNFLVSLPSFLPSKFIYFLQPVHNIYLLIFSEIGIFGFCIFLLFMWKSISGLVYGIWVKKKLLLPPYTIYKLPFIMLLLLGFVDHYPLSLQQGQLMLSLSIGLLFL